MTGCLAKLLILPGFFYFVFYCDGSISRLPVPEAIRAAWLHLRISLSVAFTLEPFVRLIYLLLILSYGSNITFSI